MICHYVMFKSYVGGFCSILMKNLHLIVLVIQFIHFLSFSVTKDFYVFYGINTELLQSGCEARNKVSIGVPWKFTTKINVAEKRFELDLPYMKEIQLISMRYIYG